MKRVIQRNCSKKKRKKKPPRGTLKPNRDAQNQNPQGSLFRARIIIRESRNCFWLANPNLYFIIFKILFYFLAAPHSTWDLSSQTRDRTRAPYVRSAVNHWTTREGSPNLHFTVKFHKMTAQDHTHDINPSTSENCYRKQY